MAINKQKIYDTLVKAAGRITYDDGITQSIIHDDLLSVIEKLADILAKQEEKIRDLQKQINLGSRIGT